MRDMGAKFWVKVAYTKTRKCPSIVNLSVLEMVEEYFTGLARITEQVAIVYLRGEDICAVENEGDSVVKIEGRTAFAKINSFRGNDLL